MKSNLLKKGTSILLSTMMVVSCFGAGIVNAFAKESNTGSCGKNVTYSLDDETGKLTISGSGEMYDYDSDSPYWEVSPFYELKDKIKEVVFEEGVTSVGIEAFADCENIEKVEFSDTVETIGNFAFVWDTGLTSIEFPDSVKTIGMFAFQSCKNLKNVKFGTGLEKVGQYAFYYCDSMERLDISDLEAYCKVQYLGPDSNPLVEVRDIENSFYLNNELVTDIVIPDTVTKINDMAFCHCYSLKSVTIPDSVKSIGTAAFYGCLRLTDVTLGDGLTRIDYMAFYYTPFLGYDDDMDEGGEIYYGNYLLSARVAGDYEIRPGTTVIAGGAFIGCEEMTGVTIPDTVISLGTYSFAFCENIKNITIPDSVTYIGDYAFDSCSGLTRVTVPDSVTYIGTCAFSSCEKLSEIKLPENLTGIGSYAFAGTAFFENMDNYENNMLYIDKYLVFAHGNNLEGDVEVKSGTKLIAGSVFEGGYDITSVTIPDSVETIGMGAFAYCKIMESITIGNGVKSIGDKAFYGCYNLKDVYYNGSEEEWNEIEIDYYLGNKNLKNATIHFAKPSHTHTLSHIVVPATCTVDGMEYDLCTDCGETLNSNVVPAAHKYTSTVVAPTCTQQGYTEHTCSVCSNKYSDSYVPATGHSYTSEITTPATCKDEGVKTFTCACGDTYTEKIEKLTTHTWGEWVRTTEPTTTLEGTDTRKCTVCDKTETRTVEKLKVLADEKTGVEIVFENEFDKDVTVEVSEVFDGTSFQLINTNFGDVKSAIFDISTEKDGSKVQPNGKIKVRIPVPADFTDGKLFVVYLDTTNGTTTKIPVTVSDGYAEFETDHFSQYALVCQSDAPAVAIDSVEIDNAKINYKQNAKLVTRIDAADDAELTVKYESSDPSIVTVDDNGNIYGAKKGTATITFTVTDQNGYSVSDTCKVTVGYTWWQNIIRIVLFGWLWY